MLRDKIKEEERRGGKQGVKILKWNLNILENNFIK